MKKLTLQIKPNDEVTLKENLHNYCMHNTKGIKQRKVDKTKICKDPMYVLCMLEAKLFAGKRVVVEYTTDKAIYDIDSDSIVRVHYIHVVDRNKTRAKFPVEFISRNHALYRDHKRMSLHNKTLITKTDE